MAQFEPVTHMRKWWVRNRDVAPAPKAAEPVDLDSLTKPELAAMAEAAGKDPGGSKADLVERLSDDG